MQDEELLRLFRQVQRFARGGKRAPHKPLLLLVALARLQRGDDRWISFREIEDLLRDLIRTYGPDGTRARSEYPFWRLRNDNLWEIREEGTLDPLVNASGDLPVRIMRLRDVHGGIRRDVHTQLRARPMLVNMLVQQILDDSFPPTIHEQILDQVGFPWIAVGPGSQPLRPRRDPRFREHVLRIYERRCAVCGYEGRLGKNDLALEAAHIKWHAFGGPDTPDNGLALCSFHHLALDLGALTVAENLTLRVSQHAIGNEHVEHLLLRFSGRSLRRPLPSEPLPAEEFLCWHWEEVFRKPAR